MYTRKTGLDGALDKESGAPIGGTAMTERGEIWLAPNYYINIRNLLLFRSRNAWQSRIILRIMIRTNPNEFA